MEGETTPITIEPTATPATATEAPPSSIPDASGDTNAASATSESASAGTTSDEDKKPEDEDSTSKESERKAILDQEVAQVGDTLENSMANAFGEQLTAAGADEREQLMSENPGLQLLRTRQGAKSATQIPPGQIHLLTGDQTGVRARYKTQNGDSIIGIIHVNTRNTATPDTHMLTLRVINNGNPEDVQMTRAELLDLMYQKDRMSILESYSSAARPLMEKYYAGLSGKEKPADYYENLPTQITEVAEAHGIITTGNLRRAGEHYFTHTDIPPTATAEESARITAENVQKAADLAELRKQLGENSLASAQQIKSTMELLGITPANLSKTLETVRASIPAIEKAIANEKDDVKKKDYKERLDTLRATADIYQEVQGMLDPTDTEGKHIQKYLDDQRAGTVTIELGKSIAAHMEKGEIETLIQMVSPESSVTATAEQKKKFREAREKHDRILKGVGITAAVLALLIALGISQGAKQQ